MKKINGALIFIFLGMPFLFFSCQKVDEQVSLSITDPNLFFKVQPEKGFFQLQPLGITHENEHIVPRTGNRLVVSRSGLLQKQSSIDLRPGRYMGSQSGERFIAASVNSDPLAEMGSLGKF
ncbi:MAG: hypothetical protein NZ480_06630 [Bdellovibrionaceae bacterium]|nr:hypothetical protein [Pseudobdellovibrionaceae bacterium]MDW8191273.1 hypothetical protein [Pseudobdellovibrionaceae bacterium]